MEFRFKKLYHLTVLVEDLAEAEAFYDRIFAPHCFMRGYAPLPMHRDAALLAIADTVIEPMRPRPPDGGDRGTSIYRFLERFGPRAHSLAFLVDGHEQVARRFDAAGIRWTDGQFPNHVFPHPKDFPGLLELADFGPNFERMPNPDPRLRAQYDQDYWRAAHPLGISSTSHFTLVVRDCRHAAAQWVDLLGAVLLPDQPSRTPGARSTYVALSEGTIIEFAEPVDSSCPLADDLARVGGTWTGITFRVVDAVAVASYLEHQGFALASRDPRGVILDRAETFGVQHAFTDQPLVGDTRPH